jgi:membrane protein YqaA with SNARE-associated domain
MLLRVSVAETRYDGLRERAASPAAGRLGFLWGFAEATLFFIVPDVLLGAVALFSPRSAARVLALTLAGALVGGTVTYLLASEVRPARSEAIVDAVPTVRYSAIRRVGREMHADGPRSVVYGPVRMGTPYKLYARAAGAQEQSLGAFLLWSVPGRLERMLPVTLLAALVGLLGQRWIAKKPRATLGLYATGWVAVYAVYVVRVGI